MQNLSPAQLADLLRKVFNLKSTEPGLAFLVDLPDERVPDNPGWADRRKIAGEWFTMLSGMKQELPFQSIVFCVYPNAGSNNNDLPAMCTVASTPEEFSRLPAGRPSAILDVLKHASVVLAPTELSATAPLKMLAKSIPFRGATLPGFSRAMLPALMLDYVAVNDRVVQLKERMDRAEGLSVSLAVEGTRYDSYFDLRYRTGHASGGLMPETGVVGNLPSGEAYIVPYEGERAGDPSRTAGLLPVQFGEELVVYRLERNSAVEILTSGPVSASELAMLQEEPAYGNIAEIGMGVLGEWGVQAAGSILLDEKLGLHIAFGRSEHFGGITSPSSFRDPRRVIHIDRVYVPSTQPLVHVGEATFHYPDGTMETVLRDGKYVV
jgi:hypothetical protein